MPDCLFLLYYESVLLKETALSKQILPSTFVVLTGLFAACLLAVSLVTPSVGQGFGESSSSGEYQKAQFTDPVSRLNTRLKSGQARLEWYGRHGFLRSVLRELDISPASQTLVFSKTSLQRGFITPQTPRAIYFNDTTYVAWIPDAPILEISSTDPRWGATFYTIVQNEPDKTNPSDIPRFSRQTFDCMSCHQSALTENVPGPTVRSVYALADGQPELSGGSFVSGDRSPFSERWGGWYVTGTHGRQRHMGNSVARGGVRDRDGNVTGLDEQVMNKFENRPVGERRTATLSRLESANEPLVKALLFSGAPVLKDPVAGTSSFAEEFAARNGPHEGPRDKAGRSLRDLDLSRRLLRYPCSYCIYSEAFDALPAPSRDYVYRRIGEILNGNEKYPGEDFAHLSREDRRAIDEILRETKPGYAALRAAAPRNGESAVKTG